MRVGLKAGAELDLLTPEEHKAVIEAQTADLKSALSMAPFIMRRTTTVTADGSGNVGGGMAGNGVPLFRPAANMSALVHRISLASSTATPSAPVTSGWLAFFYNSPSPSTQADFVPSPNLVPSVWSEGTSGIWLLGGEMLVIAGAGLPANTTFSANIQVELFNSPGPGNVTPDYPPRQLVDSGSQANEAGRFQAQRPIMVPTNPYDPANQGTEEGDRFPARRRVDNPTRPYWPDN